MARLEAALAVPARKIAAVLVLVLVLILVIFILGAPRFVAAPPAAAAAATTTTTTTVPEVLLFEVPCERRNATVNVLVAHRACKDAPVVAPLPALLAAHALPRRRGDAGRGPRLGRPDEIRGGHCERTPGQHCVAREALDALDCQH